MADQLEDTQPHKRSSLDSEPTRTTPSTEARARKTLGSKNGAAQQRRHNRKQGPLHFLSAPWLKLALLLAIGLIFVSAASASYGWSLGRSEYGATATMEADLFLFEQYNLALADMEAGNYDLARQRLEFIFVENAEFLDVADKWVEAMLVLGLTSVPTDSVLPSATPTPTEDPRPKEQLFLSAEDLITNREWTSAIDTLLALRKNDSDYERTAVDGLLYLALRNRGVQNILEFGLFEPGLYDFTLSEQFGPLDGRALNYQEWARYYLYGNAFWLAYPQEAAYYYGQLVSLAPDLRDNNGLSAFYRYWQSLIHYADQLANADDWCQSSNQYELAINARADAQIQTTADYALEMCIALTPSATFTASATSGPAVSTSTATLALSQTPSPSRTAKATSVSPTKTKLPSDTPVSANTNTPSPTPVNTATPSATIAASATDSATPSDTPPATDTDTPTPTDTPPASDTPTPSDVPPPPLTMKKLTNRLLNFFKQNRRTAIVMLAVFLLLAVLISPYVYSFARRAGSAQTGLFGLPLLSEPDPSSSGEGAGSLDIFKSSDPGFQLPDPWDGAERITILVMGLDYRDWQADLGPSRTDTMILFTLDPVTKTAGMLSIPRDLWTVIPGFTPNKINTAYYFGELYNVPGGGPGLAMKTVEQTIGVPIDYYAQVDFNTFINFIDLIGGVKIDVPTAITIDPLGADTIPKNIKPGRQVLTGILALAYARERHAPGGDFARSQRQQQIVIGIHDRILEFNLLPALVSKAPQIFTELSSGIDTNLILEDAIRIAILASQIDPANIKKGVIGEEYIIYGSSPDELAILIPIPDKIRALRDEIFTNLTALGPLTQGSLEERFAFENAGISLQNGTSNTQLAADTESHLQDLGANILELRSASTAYTSSTIIDHTGNPFAIAYLSDWMGITGARIIHDFNPNAAYDIELILGSDWLSNNPFP